MEFPFHAVTTQWFFDGFRVPTEVQVRSWPVIASGGHVLVTAPTGTGKTLAAFLVGIDRLLTGNWPCGGLRLLYVSPLKALNNDIQRNLLVPLEEIQKCFASAELCPPQVKVMVRSGDTLENERRQLRRRPPEILITTPESLNILLTQSWSAELFGGLRAVIVDEIHAVVGSKRGTALLTALERLVPLAGEFQRIGLSATVNPPGLVAQALGGFGADGSLRRVAVVSSSGTKEYQIEIVVPEYRPDLEDSGKVFWESLALELRNRVGDRASTLIFTNSRRACEKLARLINENQGELLAYSHHGSLSKEIRHEVEQKLKTGDLRALVATNSLELGIDIGDLDEIILAQTPRTASSAIQKVGRAGHQIGKVSRARLYPSHGLDLVEATVIVRCIRQQSVEPLAIPEGPLDVLAQTLLSELCARPATPDDLFLMVRRSWPYRALGRRAFDLVVDMLAGRYAGSRIPELRPRIEVDSASGSLLAKSSVPFLLYSSGGTIPSRGYFSMRDLKTGATLGELDEEFVWERAVGDRFSLGAQVWKIAAIDDQSVRVESVEAPPHIIPFWKAEDQDRSWFLAEKIALFLEEADRILGTEQGTELQSWKTSLIENEGFSLEAVESLIATLVREREALGTLPHRWRMVIESVELDKRKADGEAEADQYVVHTFWGAKINRPWAFALAQAWEDRFGYALETYPGDDQILFMVPPETDLDEALSLVTAENLEELLRKRLESTGYFGARFREGAGRALLLPRLGFEKRTPFWQTRLKSKRLFEAVAQFTDFPILIEAWRQCLHDDFDLPMLKQLLSERATGKIGTWNCRTTQPSPFTEGLLWRQINEKMYEGDDPPARRASELDPSVWNELLAGERPRLPRPLILDWESRWGCTAPGYAPETPSDLADFLEVRIALSPQEWDHLAEACARDSGRPRSEWEREVPVVRRDGRIGIPTMAGLWDRPESLWLRWLEGRGPIALASMAEFWGQSSEVVEAWASRQTETGLLVLGFLSEDAVAAEVCLSRTWDQLVRRLRTNRRSSVPVRPARDLAQFLARWQGLTRPEHDALNLERRVGPLIGLPLDAELWEAIVLPSRTAPYHSAEFDRLFVENGLRWFGVGAGRVVLGFPEDRQALVSSSVSPEDTLLAVKIFGTASPPGDRSFADLASSSQMTTRQLTEALWSLAWKGLVSSTSFAPLRQGLRSGFHYESSVQPGKVSARGFQRWAVHRGSAGVWIRWDENGDRAERPNALEQLEGIKHRARLVLDRYGVIFRALLVHEGPNFQWKALFPGLRLMELSGEIVGGLFWEGIPGLQFATPEALRVLETEEAPAVWVQNAQDPSSLCGLGLDAFSVLPRRTAATWLWWRGPALVGTLSANGKKLTLGTELDQADLNALVKRMESILLGANHTHWILETVDGVEAAESVRALSLIQAGFKPHGDKLILWKT